MLLKSNQIQNQKLFVNQLNFIQIMKKNIYFKLLALFIFQSFFTTNVWSQSTVDVSKSATAIRLVDNKGTVKYLQSNNGITQIVNTTGDKTTTTWQLGGTLTDNTFIDVSGKVFGLDKIDLVDTALLPASNDAVDKSAHGTGTGWTILVRDEATGAIKKMKALDFVSSGNTVFDALSDDTTLEIGVSGLLASTPKSRISVYRNGIKLLPTDFTHADGKVIVSEVTTGIQAWTINSGDTFEIQWLK